ncbi:MAG: DNA-directed RNA polymerase subunit alpha [Chlamydiae bacterium]|nr:DNA-directed RNA polymerase subunit alpha [Chlamydiota bacterium]
MAVMYGKFELPNKIKIDESTRKENFLRFIAEPFERGFGHTIGNALRRVMLTSLEAPAIVSVRIEGVPHEYMAVEGIIEDMTHVILNLKGALLRKLLLDDESGSREPRVVSKILDVTPEMLEKGNGQHIVTLKELMLMSDFDVVNPDMKVFTATKVMTRRIDLKIAVGRGYVPSERHPQEGKGVDEIVIDSAFSPVRLVNYYVENTRVGQDTDYDRLIVEVQTDGRVKPEEALTFAVQIGVLHFQVFDQVKLHSIAFDKGESEVNSDRDAMMAKLALKINEIELSVRSTNCLSGASIETIAELVVMPEIEMLKFRNFGKKSLNEIKAKLEEMGLYLGMDLNKFGVNRDNVKDVIQEYINQKIGTEA